MMKNPIDYQQVQSVLFVCMGNICRSPTAHAVFQAKALARGQALTIDSAGTGGWHTGSPPDPRAIRAGEARGYDLNPLRARQVVVDDFDRFDLILAMDQDNLADLHKMAPSDRHPKIQLFLSHAVDQDEQEVPDPYYGGAQGFSYVLDLIEAASEGLLSRLD